MRILTALLLTFLLFLPTLALADKSQRMHERQQSQQFQQQQQDMLRQQQQQQYQDKVQQSQDRLDQAFEQNRRENQTEEVQNPWPHTQRRGYGADTQ